MARPKRQTATVTNLAGMNTTDPPVLLLPGQAELIQNVDLSVGGMGEKRAGFQTGPTDGTPPTGIANRFIVALFRHGPNGNDASAELWAVVKNGSGTNVSLHRFAAGVWTTVPFTDTPSSGPDSDAGASWSFATFNHKLFIAYDSAVNRLHVWDGVSLRRVGIAPPAFFSDLNLTSIGAGALSFTRFYRVRFRTTVGSPQTVLLSEPSPIGTITIAASSGVRIARPPLVDGNEQAWHIDYADTANGPWFEFAQVPIGTLTFDDTAATINTTFPSRELGLFVLPPSAKYLSVYQNSLIMAGAWETTALAGQTVPDINRVWFTRPLHTFDLSDDESIPNTLTFKFWVDVGMDNDQVTGLSFPLDGIPYAMKSRQVWPLIPTDDPQQPFRAVRITDTVGVQPFSSLTIGEDELGRPALYFATLNGLYRIGRGGLQYVSRDLAEGTAFPHTAQMLWVARTQQLWVLNAGNRIFVYNARLGSVDDRGYVRNGWATYDLEAPNAILAGAMFSSNFSAFNPEWEPVIAGFTPSLTGFLWQYQRAANTDAGVAYRGVTRLQAFPFGEFLYNVAVYPPRLYVTPVGGSGDLLIQCRVFRNLGTDLIGVPPQVSTATATEFGAVPTPIITFEGISWSDGEVYQFEIGDIAPDIQRWRFITFVAPYQRQEEAE